MSDQTPIFKWPVRIYWEDTDAGGIVFHANYLKFFERARTEWLRSLGFDQHDLSQRTGGLFVVAATDVRYLQPARLDNELIVTSKITKTGNSSMSIGQQALLKSEHYVLLCEADIRLVWVNSLTLQPAKIPTQILDQLN